MKEFPSEYLLQASREADSRKLKTRQIVQYRALVPMEIHTNISIIIQISKDNIKFTSFKHQIFNLRALRPRMSVKVPPSPSSTFIASKFEWPTPTITMDKGSPLASTIAF